MAAMIAGRLLLTIGIWMAERATTPKVPLVVQSLIAGE